MCILTWNLHQLCGCKKYDHITPCADALNQPEAPECLETTVHLPGPLPPARGACSKRKNAIRPTHTYCSQHQPKAARGQRTH